MSASGIQNEDIKSAADLASAGGTTAQLPNDTKIWLTGLLTTLDQAILQGLIFKPQIIATKVSPQSVSTGIDLTTATASKVVVFVVGAGPVSITRSAISGTFFVGQEIVVMGTDNANTVTISDFPNGEIVLGLNQSATILYDGTNLIDIGRST